MHELAEMIQAQAAALVELGLSRYASWQLEEAHTSTYFVFEGHDALVETHRGGRPGSPYADVIHEFILLRIMERVEEKCQAAGVLADSRWDGERSLEVAATREQAGHLHRTCEASIADDVVMFVDAENAKQLVPNLKVVAAITFDAFRLYGAQPNMDRGKSNVIPIWHGRGSREERIAAMCDANGQIPFDTIDGEQNVGWYGPISMQGGTLTPTAPSVRRLRPRRMPPERPSGFMTGSSCVIVG